MNIEGTEHRKRVEQVRLKILKAGRLLNEAEELNKSLFPIGSQVFWMHGQYQQTGIVIRHGYKTYLWAENLKTGKQVKISNYDMAEVYTPHNRPANAEQRKDILRQLEKQK